MAQSIIERLKEKKLGLEIAVQCEVAVVNVLLSYRNAFLDDDNPLRYDKSCTRRIAQLLDSENNVRRWTEEISDLEKAIDSLCTNLNAVKTVGI